MQNHFKDAEHYPYFWTPKKPPRLFYQIECRLNQNATKIIGNVSFTLNNPCKRPFYYLALSPMRAYKPMIELSVEGRTVFNGTVDFHGLPYRFKLPEPLKPNEKINIFVRFSYKMGFAKKDKRLILRDWHPKLWQGVDTHDDYDVVFHLPDDVVAISTGLTLSAKPFHAQMTNARSFGIALAYAVEPLTSQVDGIVATALPSPSQTQFAQTLLPIACEAIAFYIRYYGFYPYPTLTLLTGVETLKGGAPIATNLITLHGKGQESLSYLKWITAHEIGHQYWGEYIIDPDSPAWLWLGLGLYGDRAFCLAHGLGLEHHQAIMKYYLTAVQNHIDTRMNYHVDDFYKLTFNYNQTILHGKSYAFISALSELIGRKTFESIMKALLTDFADQPLGVKAFQQVCETHTEQNLDEFFNAFINTSRYASCAIESLDETVHNSVYTTTVRVADNGTLALPAPLCLEFIDNSVSLLYINQDSSETLQTLTVTSACPIQSARLDPDGFFPIVAPPPELTLESLTWKICNEGMTKGKTEPLVFFREAQRLKLTDPKIWETLGALLFDAQSYDEAIQAFRYALDSETINQKIRFSALVWLGILYDLLGQREKAIEYYAQALALDQSVEKPISRLNILVNEAWLKERLKEAFKLDDDL